MRSGDDDHDERPRPLPGRGRDRGGWRFTTPAVLLLLSQVPAHGYELLARLGEVFPRSGGLPDPGAFYRLLRGLESEGAVTSSWETPQAGPARRVYAITEDGLEQLDGWVVAIERDIKAMREFVAAYRTTSSPRPEATNVSADERTGDVTRGARANRDSGTGRR